MKIGDRIKIRRKEIGMSQTELADKIGSTKQNIYKYENGIITNIPSDKVEAIAAALSTTPAVLMGWADKITNAPSFNQIIGRVVSIRFLGSVAAGYNQIANDEHEYLNVPEDWLGRRRPDDFFALRVKGDSMYPKYCNGDEILCLHDESPAENGQVYVVLYGDDEATLKKIECSPNEGYIDLVPINPMFPPKRIEGADLDQFRILGRVVRLIRTEDKDIDNEEGV